MIPSRKECFLLLEQYNVPEHIIQHSQMVQKVALSLCLLLNRQGENLDCAMVEAASLLHDIAKIQSLDTGTGHDRAGAHLLHQLGYPKIAEIVRQHVVLDDEIWDHPFTEVALVYYADKRVKHTQIVSLAERFQDLQERYGRSPSSATWLSDLGRRCHQLEAAIFQRLPVSPDMLNSFADSQEQS